MAMMTGEEMKLERVAWEENRADRGRSGIANTGGMGSDAAVYDEQDGDFLFTRSSKRARTSTTAGRRTRSSMETVVENGAVNHHAAPAHAVPAATTAPEARRPSRGRPPTKKRTAAAAAAEDRALEPVATPRNDAMDTSMDDGPAGEGMIYGQEHHEPARKIALPFSDTPIMDRNKELRRKGGAGGNGARRSSLGMRGRRASSLIENGHSAIPHREVNAGEFYKHIEADVMEPRRMKQLLTWCGERALLDRPAHGSVDSMNSNAILGGKSCHNTDGARLSDACLIEQRRKRNTDSEF